MNKTKYLLRSLLFVPGNKPNLIKNATETKADALILDLEDSVANTEKKIARKKIKSLLDSRVLRDKQIFIRLNDIESGLIEQEVFELMHAHILGFVFPKIYSSAEISYFDDLLDRAENKNGFPKSKFKLIPLIETTSAVLNILKICQTSSRIIAVALGSEDYLAELQGDHTKSEIALRFPREMIANAARAADVIPIDTLNTDVHNLVKLEKKLHLTSTLGFEGSLLLHPKEIELANNYYSPSQNDINKANQIIKLSEETRETKQQVKIVDGIFIGPPLVRKAKKIIERAEQIKNFERK